MSLPKHQRLRRTSWILLPAILVTVATAGAQVPTVQSVVEEMERTAGAPVEATFSASTGLTSFLRAPSDNPIPVQAPSTSSAEERARAFLTAYGQAFGVAEPTQVSVRRVSGPDEVGMEHVRFRQTFGGIPVTGGELSVHLRGDGVVAVNAETLDGIGSMDLRPALDPDDVTPIVEAVVEKHLDVRGASFSVPVLEIFNQGLLDGRTSPSRLAWFVEARGEALREFFWVDAQRGFVLLHFSQLPEARVREIYDGGSAAGLPGALVRSEGGAVTGDADADAAYDFSGDTYDYFFDEHGRDSYDGAGATLVSTVHHCPSPAECPFVNAFWNGVQMVYGEGFPAADDVDAHELTHAVTENSAALFYYMQSGALNESFSDIFGETVDLGNSAGTDTPEVRWQMGEDVPGLGAIRDMMDPTLFGDPGKVSDSQFVCADPGGDRGGVHSNSGVPNHAYALMVDGGSYNGESITGIGLTKAGKIQYRTLTEYLLSASDFLDDYQALRQSCRDLVGTSGITVADCVEVDKALAAVEMSSPWPCVLSPPSVPELCPFGNPITTLYLDDFGNPVSGNWGVNVVSGVDHWGGGLGDDGLYWTEFATSSGTHLWGFDSSSAGNSAAEMTSDVAIPVGGALLQFNHSFGFENTGPTFYDGSVVEYSTNSGGTWLDAGALITRGATYVGPVPALGGVTGFAADSYGYTASQLDLLPLANQSVRFRLRVGTDDSVSDYGWFIDDVRIYTCGGVVSPYDQTDFPSANDFTSQEFEAGQAAFTAMAADDFVVPSGTWKIGGVSVEGVYDSTGGMPLLNVAFSNNSGGLPGSDVCSYDGLRSGIDFSDSHGSVTVKLPTPCCLTAGTYWLMTQSDMDFATSGQWFWRQRTVQTGFPFAWQNPGNGFGTGCTTWAAGNTCTASDPDLLFTLWQVGPVPTDLTLSGETVDSTLLYEASNSITAENFHLAAPANITLRAAGTVTLKDGFSVESGSSLQIVLAAPTSCP